MTHEFGSVRVNELLAAQRADVDILKPCDKISLHHRPDLFQVFDGAVADYDRLGAIDLRALALNVVRNSRLWVAVILSRNDLQAVAAPVDFWR